MVCHPLLSNLCTDTKENDIYLFCLSPQPMGLYGKRLAQLARLAHPRPFPPPLSGVRAPKNCLFSRVNLTFAGWHTPRLSCANLCQPCANLFRRLAHFFRSNSLTVPTVPTYFPIEQTAVVCTSSKCYCVFVCPTFAQHPRHANTLYGKWWNGRHR